MKSGKTDGRKKDENYTDRNGDGESRYADPGRLVRAGTGRRLLEALPPHFGGLRLEAVAPQAILRLIEEAPQEKICVVFSGDTGFYSGAKKVTALLQEKGYEVKIHCGVSTVQYLAAQLGRSWQDVRLVSAHGVDCDVVGQVLCGEETFFLTGGDITPQTIIHRLCAAGLGGAQVTVGEALSYPDERIITQPAQALLEQTFAPLSAVWVRRPALDAPGGFGLADEQFLRGEVPMTKQEVRAAILGKLSVRPGETVYDVGAGTGSVGIELARLSPLVRVYAIENAPQALDLIEQNRGRFGVYNLTVVPGTAPDIFDEQDLPVPDAVFIGGSKGRMGDIIRTVCQKNPSVRLLVSAIALETLQQTLDACKQEGLTQIQVTQIAVSRTRPAGQLHLLMAQNPVFLIQASR